LIYLACRARGASSRASALLAVGSYIVTAENLAMRPQLFAVLLFCSVMWMLSVRVARPGLLYAIPAVAAIWSNLHGSFFLAPALCGLAWLEDRAHNAPTERTTLAVGIACVPATLVNPFGWRVWDYVVQITTNPTISHSVSEWMPPTLRTGTGVAFFTSSLVVVTLLARRKQPTPWPTLL